MCKQCISIIIVLATAAWFWWGWWDRLQTHIQETAAVTRTLESRGLSHVAVYPKSAGCYTYNALEEELRTVSGKVCLEESGD